MIASHPQRESAELTVLDLFSGCGGLSLGFKWAGFTPVLGVEFERNAAATYAANFGAVHFGDIAALKEPEFEVPRVDVIVGGPPCQGFSGLGRRDPDDLRNKLWEEYLRILRLVRPKVFVIENVPEFFKSPEYKKLVAALEGDDLKEYGAPREVVLDAADFGVPQRRKRAFVIGSLTGTPLAPQPRRTADANPAPGLQGWATVDEAFAKASIPLRPSSTELPDRMQMFEGKLLPGPFQGLEIHVGRNYRPMSIERYRRIAPGEGRFVLPDELLFPCWIKKRTGTTDVLGRLEGTKPSVTIRTEFFKPEKGRYLHPHWMGRESDASENRAITHLEAAVLQTFPTDFQWIGSKVEIARQIGNAVPPLLAYEIAVSSVLPSINGVNAADEGPAGGEG